MSSVIYVKAFFSTFPSSPDIEFSISGEISVKVVIVSLILVIFIKGECVDNIANSENEKALFPIW